jgi:CDP-glycerol glycerophosphotransferase
MIIFSSFLNKNFNSNSKYLFLWFIKNVEGYTCYFVINDDELRVRLTREIGYYFIETNTLKGKIFASRASIWFVSSLESPIGCFCGAYNRTVIHLGHGTPLKNVGLLEKNLSFLKKIYYMLIGTNISYAIASSLYFKKTIAKFIGLPENKILISGQSRNDQLFIKSELNIESIIKRIDAKSILYAPTWRHSKKTEFFPFGDFSERKMSKFLIENNIHIFIRVHPNFQDDIENDRLKIPNIYSFPADTYVEIMDYLNEFDLLITDYSSIYFDYLLLNRPIIFLPYDYNSYEKEVGFTVPYNEFTPGYKPSTMKDFIDAIYTSFYGKDEFEEERKKINAICNSFQKENRKEFVKMLYENNIILQDQLHVHKH